MPVSSVHHPGASAPIAHPLQVNRQGPRLATTLAVAGAIFVVAYENGGYGLAARSLSGIAVWWALVAGFGMGLLPRQSVPRSALVVGGLFAGFALWTLASTAWAPSAENAFNEFNRVSLYLGVYVLAVAAATRATVSSWLNGIALGIVATCVVALLDRLFPHLFPSRGTEVYLIWAAARLSFPLGYWNGLAILAGLAFPLVLRAALAGRTTFSRAAALMPLPCLTAVLYLTASRGGFAVAAIGIAVFVVATPRRWAALATLTVGAATSAAGLAALVNVPKTSSEAVNASGTGWSGAGIVLAFGVLAALLYAGGERLLRGVSTPPRLYGRVLLAVAVALAVAGIALSHPIRRFDTFKRPVPAVFQTGSADFSQSHLLSGNGSGRWQFWGAAVHEFEADPLQGGGAGSYAGWWAQHATFTYFLRNAHSLYLEVLAELGIVGLVLLLAVFVGGAATGVRRLRVIAQADRTNLAAVLGGLAAFAFGAAIDWVWQLTVVGLCGMVLLGLVTGPATAAGQATLSAAKPGRSAGRLALGAAGLAVAWALVIGQAIPWFASAKLADSQQAARRGDLQGAVKAASDARSLQPWAASPYLQLALLAEQQRALPRAESLIVQAIQRDRVDWQLWYVRSRLAAKAGRAAEARRDLARAVALNPRSPFLAGAKQAK